MSISTTSWNAADRHNTLLFVVALVVGSRPLMWSFWRAQGSPEKRTTWFLVGLLLALAVLSKFTEAGRTVDLWKPDPQ